MTVSLVEMEAIQRLLSVSRALIWALRNSRRTTLLGDLVIPKKVADELGLVLARLEDLPSDGDKKMGPDRAEAALRDIIGKLESIDKIKGAESNKGGRFDFDDGTSFYLSGIAGGRSPDGLYGHVLCTLEKPDGSQEIKRYSLDRKAVGLEINAAECRVLMLGLTALMREPGVVSTEAMLFGSKLLVRLGDFKKKIDEEREGKS